MVKERETEDVERTTERGLLRSLEKRVGAVAVILLRAIEIEDGVEEFGETERMRSELWVSEGGGGVNIRRCLLGERETQMGLEKVREGKG